MEVNFLEVNRQKKIQCIRWDTQTGERIRDEQWCTPISDIFAVTANEDSYTISTRKNGWYSIHRVYDIRVDGVKMTFEEFVSYMDKTV